jgi:hypothetical protein
MTVELSEQDISRIVEALDPMAGYQRAVDRDHAPYQEIGDCLQALKKMPVSVTSTEACQE